MILHALGPSLVACMLTHTGQTPVEQELEPAVHGLVLSEGLTLLRHTPGRSYDHQGHHVRVLPDLDGDGSPEVAITARPWVPGLTSGVGYFEVRSGRTWAKLFRVDGEQPDDPDAAFGGTDLMGQSLVVVDDATGDGVPDLFATGGDDFMGKPYLKLISGADGSIVKRIEGDVFHLVDLGDVNGDGKRDVGVRRPFNWEERPTRVISGADGTELGALAPAIMGRTGDLDGDGSPDYVVCGSRFDATGVVSASIGEAPAKRMTWTPPSDGLVYMSRIGLDLDGDGFVDPLQIRYLPGRGGSRWPAKESAFDLFVLDGRADKVVLNWRIELPEEGRITWVGGLGDIDGDGTSEIGVSMTTASGGMLSIRSGKTGDVLATARGESWTFGASVVNAGDLDGDGCPELIVGDFENSRAGRCAGAVFVLSIQLEDH